MVVSASRLMSNIFTRGCWISNSSVAGETFSLLQRRGLTMLYPAFPSLCQRGLNTLRSRPLSSPTNVICAPGRSSAGLSFQLWLQWLYFLLANLTSALRCFQTRCKLPSWELNRLVLLPRHALVHQACTESAKRANIGFMIHQLPPLQATAEH